MNVVFIHHCQTTSMSEQSMFICVRAAKSNRIHLILLWIQITMCLVMYDFIRSALVQIHVLTGFECRPAVQAVVQHRGRPAAEPEPSRVSVNDPRRRQTFRFIRQKPHVPR